PVARVEFWQDVMEMRLDGTLSDAERAGNLLVRLSGRHAPQHLDLPLRQLIVLHVLADLGRDLCRNAALARIHSADGIYQLLAEAALQQVPRCAGPESLQCLDITGKGRYHDESGIRVLRS